MSVYNKIVFNTSSPINDSIGGTKITLVDFSAILIEGHKGIFRYHPEEIIVQLKKGKIIINGSKLLIDEINLEEVLIKGEIVQIAREL